MLSFSRLEMTTSTPPLPQELPPVVSKPKEKPSVQQSPEKKPSVQSLDLKKNWAQFIHSLGLEGIVRQLASNTSFFESIEQAQGLKICLRMDKKNESLITEKILHRLASVIGAGLGQKVFLEIQSSAAEGLQTPAKQRENELLMREKLAHEKVNSDVCVQEIQEAFSAQIDTNTVQLVDKK